MKDRETKQKFFETIVKSKLKNMKQIVSKEIQRCYISKKTCVFIKWEMKRFKFILKEILNTD